MRKLPSVSIDERPRSPMRRATTMLVLFILLILSPVIYESGKLLYANWRSFLGTYTTVETPVLNAISDAWAETSVDLRNRYRGTFARTPWRASVVVPFAIFWTGVLAMLLRRC
jgi:hypothetical protein